MRTVGLPYLTLWRTLMKRRPPLMAHEDSQAMIRVVQTGRNPRCDIWLGCVWLGCVKSSKAHCISWYTRNRVRCALTSIPKGFRSREIAGGLWPDQCSRPRKAYALGRSGARGLPRASPSGLGRAACISISIGSAGGFICCCL